MSQSTSIIAIGAVDERGLVGTGVPCLDWSDAGADPWSDGFRPELVFEAPFPRFARLDALSRSVCLAMNAAGVQSLIAPAARSTTALVAATTCGCLDADRRFFDGLKNDRIEPSMFSYTLASTSLGEAAIRFGLTGPCTAMSVEPGCEGEAFATAELLLRCGEADHAVVLMGDALTVESAATCRVAPRLRLIAVVVLATAGSHRLVGGRDDLVAFDPVDRTIARLRRRFGKSS